MSQVSANTEDLLCEEALDVVKRLAVAGIVVAAVSIGATLVVGMVEGTLLPYDRLDPDSESSVFNWASSGAELIAAFVCAAQAVASCRHRAMFGVLAAVILYLSLDDAFVVHETIGKTLQDHIGLVAGIGEQVWTAAYAPLLVATALLLWRVVRGVRREADVLLLVGLTCFALAIGFEVMGATPLGEPLGFVVAEEALELGGWELAAAALTIVLATSLMRISVSGREAQVPHSLEARP